MTRPVETRGRLNVSIALHGQPLLSVQLQHRAGLESEGRRARRALRARAMAGLVKAWAGQPAQQRWREGLK